MVNIVFTVVSLFVLVVAVVTKSQTASVLPNQSETEVLSATSQVIPITSPMLSPTFTPTSIPVSTATPSATPTATSSISEWIYTGQMSEKSVTESALSFTTTDAPKVVTAWYKEKTMALGYSSNSFIQTESNAKVLNKISGSKEIGSVAVEISKDSDVSPTHVTITLDTDARSSDVNVSVNNSI